MKQARHRLLRERASSSRVGEQEVPRAFCLRVSQALALLVSQALALLVSLIASLRASLRASLIASLWVSLAAVGVSLSSPSPAAAQLSERQVGVTFSEGRPRIDVSMSDFANDPEVYRKLQSGLPQTFVVRIYAYAGGSETPIAIAARSCRVVYDLWEERYRVQRSSEQGDETLNVRTLAEVTERCLVARRLPIGSTAEWQSARGQRAYFAALVEFNPVTPDTVQRIRRWLARPQRGRVDADSFFGSFVSLFVNRRIGDAERALRFRSQSVEIP